LVSFGVGKAAAWIAKAASKKQVASSVNKFDMTGMSSNQKGQMGERFVSEATGLPKNKDILKIGEQKFGIPDFVDEFGKRLLESKNVAKQGWTQQLNKYSMFAKSNSWKMEIWVRKGTTIKSSLQAKINNGDVFLQFFPW